MFISRSTGLYLAIVFLSDLVFVSQLLLLPTMMRVWGHGFQLEKNSVVRNLNILQVFHREWFDEWIDATVDLKMIKLFTYTQLQDKIDMCTNVLFKTSESKIAQFYLQYCNFLICLFSVNISLSISSGRQVKTCSRTTFLSSSKSLPHQSKK